MPDEKVFSRFILKKLTTKDAKVDFEAASLNANLIRKTIGVNWPGDDFNFESNKLDIKRHEKEFGENRSYTFGVWDPTKTRYLGCVYFYCEDKPWFNKRIPGDCDVVIEYWLTQQAFDQGLYEDIFFNLNQWLANGQLFKKPYYNMAKLPVEPILEPMTVNDRQMFFDWATGSDATPYWYGEIYGNTIPSWEEFFKDWQDYYFDGSLPLKGRCFKIIIDGQPIGQVNYNEIDNNRSVELDILIAKAENKGKGYGSTALNKMVDYLFQNMNVNLCWIDAVKDNPRAISAYQKAGFVIKNNYFKNGKEWVHLEQLREF